MSHILDALRQAEDERRLGNPPGTTTIAGPLRRARRTGDSRSFLVPVAAFVVVLALALGIWRLATGNAASSPAAEPGTGPASATRPASPAPAAGNHTTAGTTASSSAGSARPTNQTAALAGSDATASARSSPGAGAAGTLIQDDASLPRVRLAGASRPQDIDALFAAPAARQAAPRPGVAASGSTTGSTAAPAQQRPQARQQQMATANPVPVPVPAETPALAPRDLSAEPPPESAGSADPTPSRESPSGALADATAIGAPDFSIDVHVYHPDPELRFILVGGKRVAHGGRLPGGATLERINEDSITLRWQGQLARKDIQ